MSRPLPNPSPIIDMTPKEARKWRLKLAQALTRPTLRK